ncbi:MAG: hypothetical protein IPO81_10975 [Kouleothrix sp.]|nr:hypothetical protein [Kouleothrix sp.]
MDHTTDILLTDLRHLIAGLGAAGGLISPSIYDTAQVLRLAPPAQGPWPGLNWLAEQQHADGGWGDPAIPNARDLPTLAAVLALHIYCTRERERKAVQDGLSFLRRQASHWSTLSDDIPVGVELLLPRLLDEAAELGLKVPRGQYASLIALGARRRSLVAQTTRISGTPLAHSWEALGIAPDLSVVDSTGGVGHSPAATAAWLRAVGPGSAASAARVAAQRYLEQAAAATGQNIPGIAPTVWPIVRFEQSFALYMLLIAGLLDHPRLQDVVQPQIADLSQALRPGGLGMSDAFLPDGDDTAAALIVLHAAGRPVDERALSAFAADDHFCAYPGELQPSLSVTAHAVHLLALLGLEHSRPRSFVVARQLRDGRWLGDKWNGSWLYTTLQAIVALHHSQPSAAIGAAVDGMLLYQHEDGGWGTRGSTSEETAYAVLALRALGPDRAPAADQALLRGERWMRVNYRPFFVSPVTCWIGKETYQPTRLARVIELAATIPVEASVTASVA